MSPIHNGVYAICKPGAREQFATLEGPHGHVLALDSSGQPAVPECTWQVEDCDNGNVILKNLQNGTYLSCEGEPRVNKLIVGADEPREWRLQKSSESSTFQIVAPGGPIGGVELAVDVSLLHILPRKTALRPLNLYNDRQAWRFESN